MLCQNLTAEVVAQIEAINLDSCTSPSEELLSGDEVMGTLSDEFLMKAFSLHQLLSKQHLDPDTDPDWLVGIQVGRYWREKLAEMFPSAGKKLGEKVMKDGYAIWEWAIRKNIKIVVFPKDPRLPAMSFR